MAHVLVLELRLLVVHHQPALVSGFVLDDFQFFIALQAIGVHSFHFNDEVDLAGFQGDGTGGAFRNDLPSHVLNGGSAIKVIFKRFEYNAVAPVPFDELIRAGADGLCIEVMARIDQRFGHDGVAVVAQVAQQHGVGARCRDLDGVIIHDVYADDVIIVQTDFGETFRPFQRSLDVFYCHLGTIMEFDTCFNGEFPFGFADVLIVFYQIGNGVHFHIGFEQGVIGQQVHVRTGHSVVLRRRQGRGLIGCCNDNAVFCAAIIASVAAVRAAILAAARKQT